jgi:hypothetical protein
MTWETALVRGALAVYLDNVAELAIVWAAARVLDCHRGIAAHFDQAEVGQTAGLHGRPFGGLVGGRRGPTFEVARQAADQGLGFADHHVVCLEFFHREAAGNGAPNHGAQTARAATFDNGGERAALNVHATDERHIGPRNIPVKEPLDVGIDEAFFQAEGSSAATVMRPSGGCAARLPRNLSACLKLQ